MIEQADLAVLKLISDLVESNAKAIAEEKIKELSDINATTDSGTDDALDHLKTRPPK